MTEKERQKQIQSCKKIGMTDEEIAEMLSEDEKIDKMKTTKEIDSDLSIEQKEAINKTKREHSGKYEKSAEALAKEKQLKIEKESALDKLMEYVEVVEVIKKGKEFIYVVDGVKYRCTITRVRKQQENA